MFGLGTRLLDLVLSFYRWRWKDGFRLLTHAAGRLVPKYRFKWPQMAWWDEAWFSDYLDRIGERNGYNSDRRWMVLQLVRLTSSLEGDTAECGVFQGAGSELILRATGGTDSLRPHHLFDSFEGLSQPGERDGGHWSPGDLACAEDVVAGNLSAWKARLVFHKGWIPETFRLSESTRFRFVHVDVDLYEPTRDAIAWFYSRLVPGGIFVCDDYGFTTCPGATSACNEFLADKPEKMIALCSGGGFFIKGTATESTSGIEALATGNR